MLAGCPADSGPTTVTDTTPPPDTDGTGNSTEPPGTSGTSGTPTTVEPTTAGPTTVEPTTDPTTTTDGTTTDPTAGTTTTGVGDTTTTGDPSEGTTTTGDPSDGTTTDTTGGVMGMCVNGVKDEDEACDDSNLKTEVSATKQPPLKYDAAACIDDCSLVLSLCGNGKVDPGEACDDGNPDTYDGCTTSCTINDKSYHAPCKRMCNQNCDTDVASGTFTGCDNMEVPTGAKAVCYVSTKFMIAPRYFAEGECAATAQTCMGAICPPNIGNYDMLKTCPAGSTLIDRTTMTFGVTVKTKVCQKICQSDSDCRWNAYDTVWGKAGEYRCQTTADSNGVKICADAQN